MTRKLFFFVFRVEFGRHYLLKGVCNIGVSVQYSSGFDFVLIFSLV